MATVAVLAVSGCSFGGDEEAQPASGAPAQIADTVDRLERAVAAKDFAAICDRLFTAGARKRAGGDDCTRQLRTAAGDVEEPEIEIRAIDVKDDRATVTIRTEAAGQARATDELRLRRQRDRWLIDALG
jgi:Putative lumazine-binding